MLSFSSGLDNLHLGVKLGRVSEFVYKGAMSTAYIPKRYWLKIFPSIQDTVNATTPLTDWNTVLQMNFINPLLRNL